ERAPDVRRSVGAGPAPAGCRGVGAGLVVRRMWPAPGQAQRRPVPRLRRRQAERGGRAVNRTFEFSFAAPAKPLNANQRLHWAERMRLSRAWRDAAHMYARKALFQYKGWRPPVHAHVVMEFRFPDGRKRDVGNFGPTAKAIVDGCVDAGVLAADDDEHLTGPDLRRGPQASGRLAEVVVNVYPKKHGVAA